MQRNRDTEDKDSGGNIKGGYRGSFSVKYFKPIEVDVKHLTPVKKRTDIPSTKQRLKD